MKQRRTGCPWINTAVLSAIAERELAWARSRRAPKNKDLRSLYKSARNKANALLRSEKRKYFQVLFRTSDKNPTKNWAIVNQLRGGKRKNASSVLKQNFGAVSITLADEFNAFFSSSGQSSLVPGVTPNSMPSVLESAFLPLCT